MLCCSITSFTLMSVPDALCIIFACPVVTLSLSALILKDRITIPKALSGAALFLGVVFVCKPPFIFQDEDISDEVSFSSKSLPFLNAQNLRNMNITTWVL